MSWIRRDSLWTAYHSQAGEISIYPINSPLNVLARSMFTGPLPRGKHIYTCLWGSRGCCLEAQAPTQAAGLLFQLHLFPAGG